MLIPKRSYHWRGENGTNWNPVDFLKVNNSDVTLFFIEVRNVGYLQPVHDPVFWADTEVSYAVSGEMKVRYQADFPVSVMACTEQVQICDPNTTKCTQLVSSMELPKELTHLGLNHPQWATAQRLFHAYVASPFYYSVHYLAPGTGKLFIFKLAHVPLAATLPDLKFSIWHASIALA